MFSIYRRGAVVRTNLRAILPYLRSKTNLHFVYIYIYREKNCYLKSNRKTPKIIYESIVFIKTFNNPIRDDDEMSNLKILVLNLNKTTNPWP